MGLSKRFDIIEFVIFLERLRVRYCAARGQWFARRHDLLDSYLDLLVVHRILKRKIVTVSVKVITTLTRKHVAVGGEAPKRTGMSLTSKM